MKKNNLTTLGKLQTIIENKEKYLNHLMANGGNRYTTSIIFSELKLLKDEILPIVQEKERRENEIL